MGFLNNAFDLIALLVAPILLPIHDMSSITYVPTHENTHQCGFTKDFNDFLKKSKEYSYYQFQRTDINCSSYGGKETHQQQLKNLPIIFIHGNSDVAFGRGTKDGQLSWQTGFRSLATYLISQGWDKAALYTTTWGQTNSTQSQNNYYSKKNVMHLRAFIEVVLSYTNSKQIIIISHSMGVALARKAIKGGIAFDHIEKDKQYNVGSSLASKVKTFIGIAGMNLGLVSCYDNSSSLICGQIDGLFPGNLPNSGPSSFLQNLNLDKERQAENIYTIWSKYDDLIGHQCLVWGKITSRIFDQNGQIVKEAPEWGHFHLRDSIGPDIMKWLKN